MQGGIFIGSKEPHTHFAADSGKLWPSCFEEGAIHCATLAINSKLRLFKGTTHHWLWGNVPGTNAPLPTEGQGARNLPSWARSVTAQEAARIHADKDHHHHQPAHSSSNTIHSVHVFALSSSSSSRSTNTTHCSSVFLCFLWVG